MGRTTVTVAFLASWVALFYSLSLTGLGYQTGWTPWWHWLRRVPLQGAAHSSRAGAYLLAASSGVSQLSGTDLVYACHDG